MQNGEADTVRMRTSDSDIDLNGIITTMSLNYSAQAAAVLRSIIGYAISAIRRTIVCLFGMKNAMGDAGREPDARTVCNYDVDAWMQLLFCTVNTVVTGRKTIRLRSSSLPKRTV